MFNLPPYCPELNATERLWKYTRKQGTHNRYFDTVDLLQENLIEVFDQMNNPAITTNYKLTPNTVSGSIAFSQISLGGNHSCGITNAGALYCWGLNTDGQLGNSTMNNQNSPTLVSGGYTFTQIAVSEVFTLGIINPPLNKIKFQLTSSR